MMSFGVKKLKGEEQIQVKSAKEKPADIVPNFEPISEMKDGKTVNYSSPIVQNAESGNL